MRVLSVLARYQTQLVADGRSVFWRDQVRRHVALLDRWLTSHRRSRDVRTIGHEDLAAFLGSREATMRLDGRAKKQTSNNALRTSMRAFFLYVHTAGHSPRNAAALVRRAKCAPPPPRAIPPDDLRRLIATIDAAKGWTAERDSVLFHLLAETGIRIGSALAARVEDLDVTHRELRLTTTKGNRPTVITLPAALCTRFRQHLHGRASGPLFQTDSGRSLGGRQVRRRMAAWLIRAGCRPASPHALRHAFAHRVYARTGDLLRVQQALRHSSVSSTALYATSARIGLSG